MQNSTRELDEMWSRKVADDTQMFSQNTPCRPARRKCVRDKTKKRFHFCKQSTNVQAVFQKTLNI